jgi:hypothetical protein
VLVTRYRYEQFDSDTAEESTDLLIAQVAHQRKVHAGPTALRLWVQAISACFADRHGLLGSPDDG